MGAACTLRCCTGKSMIGYLGNKPFCDLHCRACVGFTARACLFGGTNHMRLIMTECMANGVLIWEKPVGLWAEFTILSAEKLPGVSFPMYLHEIEN